jgi:hypothetical protein
MNCNSVYFEIVECYVLYFCLLRTPLGGGGNAAPRYILTPRGVKKYVIVGAGKDDRGREKYSLQGIYSSSWR